MSSGEYSEDLVELVKRTIADWATAYPIPAWGLAEGDRAERLAGNWAKVLAPYVLDALSSAGRLVPEGSEVREEWATHAAAHDGYAEELSPSWEGAGSTEEERARRRADAWIRRFGAEHVTVVSRSVITTPWTPAESAQRSGVAAQEES